MAGLSLPEIIYRLLLQGISKNPYHPNGLPISPGPIAVYLETVYNEGARKTAGKSASLFVWMAGGCTGWLEKPLVSN